VVKETEVERIISFKRAKLDLKVFYFSPGSEVKIVRPVILKQQKFSRLTHPSHTGERVKSQAFSGGERSLDRIEEDNSRIKGKPDKKDSDSRKCKKKMKGESGIKSMLFQGQIGCNEKEQESYPDKIGQPFFFDFEERGKKIRQVKVEIAEKEKKPASMFCRP